MQMENKKRMPQQAPQAKADKAPAEQDTALVWGKNPVTELLKSEAGVDTLLLADSMEPRMAGYYTALGKAAGAVIKRVPAGKLQKLCGTQDHQGVAAWAARIQYVGVEELLQIAKDRGEPPFLVLCDGIEDPHNLGAILRSALLCGAHGVIIPRRGGVGVTGTVMKSSAGAAARIPVARVANLPQAIRDLKKQNIFVYCADLGGAPLEKTDLSGPVALVLGSEGAGPGALVRKLCDAAVGNTELKPNLASKHLTRHYSDVLLPLGITYEYRKTAAARLVLLELHDGADGHDGSSGSERLASLRKQNDGTFRLPQASSQASSASWEEAEDDEELPL